MSEDTEEELFNALLDKPSFYEVNGKKIPIHSLGISLMKLLLESSKGLSDEIKQKVINEEKLSEAEEKVLAQLQTEEKGKKDGMMRVLLIKTLKITFPNKSEEELELISMEHWNPLIKIIFKLNFPKIQSEDKDFQKAPPEKKS